MGKNHSPRSNTDQGVLAESKRSLARLISDTREAFENQGDRFPATYEIVSKMRGAIAPVAAIQYAAALYKRDTLSQITGRKQSLFS